MSGERLRTTGPLFFLCVFFVCLFVFFFFFFFFFLLGGGLRHLLYRKLKL